MTGVRNIRAVRLRALRLDDRNKRSFVMLPVRNGTTVRFREATTAAQLFKRYWLSLSTQSRALSAARLRPEVRAQSGIPSENGNVVPID